MVKASLRNGRNAFPLRPRAFGGMGAEGMKKEFPSSTTGVVASRRKLCWVARQKQTGFPAHGSAFPEEEWVDAGVN